MFRLWGNRVRKDNVEKKLFDYNTNAWVPSDPTPEEKYSMMHVAEAPLRAFIDVVGKRLSQGLYGANSGMDRKLLQATAMFNFIKADGAGLNADDALETLGLVNPNRVTDPVVIELAKQGYVVLPKKE